MGQATIISGGTSGSYVVEFDYGKTIKDATVASLVAILEALETRITAAQSEFDAQVAIEDAVKVTVQEKINAYIAATQALSSALETQAQALEDFESVASSQASTDQQKAQSQAALISANTAVEEAQKAIQPALDEYTKEAKKLAEERKKSGKLELALLPLKGEKAARTKDQNYWTGINTQEIKQAWCVDLTENASGTVGVLEIPGEGNIVLIKAGGAAPTLSDGRLRAREVQSPEQVYFNAAILPGWQKFKPTYRRGVITALDLDADLASVTLTDDRSSAQGLGINLVTSLDAVPVEYMACNAKAFDMGDACVVQFINQDWAQPKVIGFVSNPKPCLPQYIYVDLVYSEVLGPVTGTRQMLSVFGPGFVDSGYLSSVSQDALRVRSHEFRVSGVSVSATPITGYSLTATPTVLDTRETNYNAAAGWAPPGASGVAWGINAAAGGVQVVRTTRTVSDETHRFYSERFSGPDYSGGVYQDDESTEYMTNMGNPGLMPWDAFVRDVLGVVPVVRMAYAGKLFEYKLDTASGATLAYIYDKVASA